MCLDKKHLLLELLYLGNQRFCKLSAVNAIGMYMCDLINFRPDAAVDGTV